MTTLSCSLRSPSRFPPFAPFLSPRSRLSGCLFPAHVREKTNSYFDEETTGKARFLFVLLFHGMTGRQRRRTGRQSSRFAELSLAEGEYHCFSGFARKTFRTSSLFTITYNFSLRAALSFSRCVFAERKRILK